ncbi:MAG: NifU family protein, partial [Pseudomonadota bacterium]
FLGIEGNKVMVRLTGACVFCKLASMTLEGIQSKVVERLGELVRIVPVAGAAKARH